MAFNPTNKRVSFPVPIDDNSDGKSIEQETSVDEFQIFIEQIRKIKQNYQRIEKIDNLINENLAKQAFITQRLISLNMIMDHANECFHNSEQLISSSKIRHEDELVIQGKIMIIKHNNESYCGSINLLKKDVYALEEMIKYERESMNPLFELIKQKREYLAVKKAELINLSNKNLFPEHIYNGLCKKNEIINGRKQELEKELAFFNEELIDAKNTNQDVNKQWRQTKSNLKSLSTDLEEIKKQNIWNHKHPTVTIREKEVKEMIKQKNQEILTIMKHNQRMEEMIHTLLVETGSTESILFPYTEKNCDAQTEHYKLSREKQEIIDSINQANSNISKRKEEIEQTSIEAGRLKQEKILSAQKSRVQVDDLVNELFSLENICTKIKEEINDIKFQIDLIKVKNLTNRKLLSNKVIIG